VQPLFNLRKFEPNDLNQVIYINQTCLPENYSNSFFMELHKRFPETFIVAEKDRMVIGYIMCRVETSFSGLSFKPFGIMKRGHVISIAVLPEHRNKGVGRTLIKQALRALSNVYKVKDCYLEVRVSNKSAITLYEKVGFRIERTIRGYYSDGENAYIMSIKLGDEA